MKRKHTKRGKYTLWVTLEIRNSDYADENSKIREAYTVHESHLDSRVINYLAEVAQNHLSRKIESGEKRLALVSKHFPASSGLARFDRTRLRKCRIGQALLSRWRDYRRKYTMWSGWAKAERLSLQSVTHSVTDTGTPRYLVSCVKTRKVLERTGDDYIKRCSQKEWTG